MRLLGAIATFTIAAGVAVGASGTAYALAVPPAPIGRVSDFAGALDASARARLDAQLAGYAEGNTSQYVAAIFRSLEGESLEDFSIKLAEQWKVGGKKNSDGVIVVVFLTEHKVRIEVGYGLEDKLTDAFCARVIRDVIAPEFRSGDVAGGLGNAFAAIDEQATGRKHVPPVVHQRGGRGDGDGRLPGLVLFLVIMIVVLIARSRGGRGGGGGFGSGLFAGWLLGGSSWSGGNNGWSSGDGDSGGGFGGFGGGGGGGFGGGGASGDW